MSFLSAFLPVMQTVSPDNSPKELIVIMYHHISENSILLNDYVITPEEFENDINYLSDNGYKVISASQLLNGDIPEKAVMITFDDGFLSTYKYAKPILEKYNMTGICAVIGSVMKEYTIKPNTISDCAYMDIDTVNQMIQSGTFEIACHTFDMHNLSPRKGCSKQDIESEKNYRSVLTDDLTEFNNLYIRSFGCTTDIIAFPYGEYSGKTVEIAADMGYRIMLTCDEKINYISDDRTIPIVLGRFNRTHGISSNEFFELVTGLSLG